MSRVSCSVLQRIKYVNPEFIFFSSSLSLSSCARTFCPFFFHPLATCTSRCLTDPNLFLYQLYLRLLSSSSPSPPTCIPTHTSYRRPGWRRLQAKRRRLLRLLRRVVQRPRISPQPYKPFRGWRQIRVRAARRHLHSFWGESLPQWHRVRRHADDLLLQRETWTL